ncbi:MAG: D-alanine--D-alanine ligase [Actinobacteria bacterium]|jgi:D-alanine-D-alanine ligase|nr:D-alanine--D-alanine ligase [Actinomycetota bacterium]
MNDRSRIRLDPRILKTKTIGVLMGGLSGEREVSLRSGEKCLRALVSRGYRAVAIDAVRDVAQQLDEAGVEVAFIALHGRFGEDGAVQGLLEMMGIPYTGSGVLASALGMNKIAAKKVVGQSGVATPDYCEIGMDEPASTAVARILEQLDLPVMLKPVQEGSSLGVSKCRDAAGLAEAIERDRAQYGAVFAERYVPGREITVGVLERNGGRQVLPILELVPEHEFYDYETKYTKGMTEFIIPARLTPETYAAAERAADTVFATIGCRGYSRVDMMVDEAGVPWFIEVNTLPGMTDTSDLPAQALAAGISYEELVETILIAAAA